MKKLFIAMLALTIAASAAMATDTRIASIGQASTFLTDYTDIYFIPSTLVAYPRMIAAELGTGSPSGIPYQGSASITWTNNEEQTWGVMGVDVNHDFAGRQQFGTDITAINTWIGGPDALPHPDNKWHLFYAKKMGTMDLGLHLARAAGAATLEWTDSLGNEKDEASTGLWNINGSISLKPMENVTADISAAFQMLSFSGEMVTTTTLPAASSGTTTIESDGGSAILVGARAFYGMSDQLKLVPVLGFQTYSLGFKTSYAGVDTVGNTPEGGKKSQTNIAGAFGLNYQPAENVTLVGGLHFGMYGTTLEDTTGLFGGTVGIKEEKTSTLVFPGFSAGVEAKLLKWLDVRFGAGKMLTKTSTEETWHSFATGNNTRETSYTSAPFNFGFGLGLTFGTTTCRSTWAT
ncbi:MAG: hypothetical protein MUF78_03020 [Candidatus Edwardsbacteria bacterium]|nr:hypothetical protein [Candidatus Edwardsbacteria bacterium]